MLKYELKQADKKEITSWASKYVGSSKITFQREWFEAEGYYTGFISIKGFSRWGIKLYKDGRIERIN